MGNKVTHTKTLKSKRLNCKLKKRLNYLDSSFICCPERTTNGVNIDTVRNGFGNADDGLSQVSSLPESTQRNINERYLPKNQFNFSFTL